MPPRSDRRYRSAPPRPALPYYGSKWRLSSWVQSFFPPHELYVEPFGGSAAVLLRKEPARVEIYNDLDDQVVNLFRVLRGEATRSQLLELLELTPYAKQEFLACCENSDDLEEPAAERARRFFVRGWQGWGAAGASTDKPVGWGRTTPPALQSRVASWLSAVPNLKHVTERLRLVHIEHDSAWRIFDRYDSEETLFYVDPPYVESTLTANKDYRHGFTEADHRRLAEQLEGLQGMVVLSGFHCELYRELFGHWEHHEKKALTVGRTARGSTFRTEVLWLNRRAVERRLAAQGSAAPASVGR